MGSTQSSNNGINIKSQKYTDGEIRDNIANIFMNKKGGALESENSTSIDTLNWFQMGGGSKNFQTKKYDRYDIRKTLDKARNQTGGNISVTDTALSQSDNPMERLESIRTYLSDGINQNNDYQEGGFFDSFMKIPDSSIKTESPIKHDTREILNLLGGLQNLNKNAEISNNYSQKINLNLDDTLDFQTVPSLPSIGQQGGNMSSEMNILPYSNTESTVMSHHFPHNTSRFS